MVYNIEGKTNEFVSSETEDVFLFKFVLLTRALGNGEEKYFARSRKLTITFLKN